MLVMLYRYNRFIYFKYPFGQIHLRNLNPKFSTVFSVKRVTSPLIRIIVQDGSSLDTPEPDLIQGLNLT